MLADQNLPLMFLRAKTPEELRTMMLKNNQRHARKFHYFNPQYVKGNWYVWFELRETDKRAVEGN